MRPFSLGMCIMMYDSDASPCASTYIRVLLGYVTVDDDA